MPLFEDVRPITPFGAEVCAIRNQSIGRAERDELLRLFVEDGLLVIRGLRLTMPEQQEFCRTFGPVPDSMYENFYVSNQRVDGFLGTKELQWHNDVPYLPSPYLVGALHAVDVDPDTASTKFASGMRAYERLPQHLKDRVGGLKALQVRQRMSERRNRLEDLEAGDLCTVHPVVRRQEGTGRPYLFARRMILFCAPGTASKGSSTPRSPRATITASLARTIASMFWSATSFSIFATTSSHLGIILRNDSMSSARRTKLSAR